MANALLTISMISYEQLRVLYNEIRFAKKINKQYDSMFAVAGAKVGSTVNARKPPRYTVRTGQAVAIQNMVETQVPITLTNQDGVDLQASTADFALSIDDFSNRFLRPAAIAIANQIDFQGTSVLTPLVSNVVGTPGTAPTTLATYLSGKTVLDSLACPRANRWAIVSSSMESAVTGGAAIAYFNPTSQISEQYKTGTMGTAVGFEWDMDQNVYTQTTGVVAATSATVTSNTATQVVLAGWTSGDIVNRGDILSFTGCLAVNPQSRQSTGDKLQQVATASATATGGGALTVNVSPGFVTSGQFQNCTANPTAPGGVFFYGSANPATYSGKSSPQGLLFHPDFGTLASADLPVYEKGVVEGYRVPAPEIGLSIRVLKAYNVMTDQLVTRSDILYGWAGLYPNELACRVAA